MDLSIFDNHIKEGYINKVISPCGKLVLFNYTEKATFEKKWDQLTLSSRGSIYELESGKIIAKSFDKFFGWNEHTIEDQDRIRSYLYFDVFEKMDGSLGIVYYYNGEWQVNTRGSFTSDQVIKGKELLKRYNTEKLDKDITYLVEIIYPENRIVVDYKGKSELVLLGCFDVKLNVELIPEVWNTNFRIASRYTFNSISEVISKLDTLPYNEEGYVVRLAGGERVKFKGKEYVEMHRIVTNTSPLSLWENMINGKVDRKLLESIPEEFSVRYVDIAKLLEKRYKEVLNEASDTTRSIAKICNNERKEIGLYLSRNDVEYAQIVFPIFLGNNEAVDKLVMKEIRPKGNIL